MTGAPDSSPQRRRQSVAQASGTPRHTRSDPHEQTQRRLDDAQKLADHGEANTQRVYRRWPYRVGMVSVLMGAGGRTPVKTQMATRDICAQGVGLLHTAFVHNKTKVVVCLPLHGGGAETLAGEVVLCRHVDGTVHQVGVVFEEEIDPSRFDPSIGTSERFAREKVETAALKGAVLGIEDCLVDRLLMEKMLAPTGLRITWVERLEEAREKLEKRWSVIICDKDLPDGKGTEFLEEVRASGNHTPFVLVTADNTQKSKAMLTTLAADAVLFKPVSERQLRESLTSLLTAPQRDGTAVSTLAKDDAAYELVATYVETLHAQADEMLGYWEGRDAEACINLAAEISGSAGPYGFGPIGDFAGKIREALEARGWTADTMTSVRRLVTLCRQVRSAEQADAA